MEYKKSQHNIDIEEITELEEILLNDCLVLNDKISDNKNLIKEYLSNEEIDDDTKIKLLKTIIITNYDSKNDLIKYLFDEYNCDSSIFYEYCLNDETMLNNLIYLIVENKCTNLILYLLTINIDTFQQYQLCDYIKENGSTELLTQIILDKKIEINNKKYCLEENKYKKDVIKNLLSKHPERMNSKDYNNYCLAGLDMDELIKEYTEELIRYNVYQQVNEMYNNNGIVIKKNELFNRTNIQKFEQILNKYLDDGKYSEEIESLLKLDEETININNVEIEIKQKYDVTESADTTIINNFDEIIDELGDISEDLEEIDIALN